jgi:hypothetical protein
MQEAPCVPVPDVADEDSALFESVEANEEPVILDSIDDLFILPVRLGSSINN